MLIDGYKKINDLITEFNTAVVEGDSSLEAAQARVDADGSEYDTLKKRLDAEHEDHATQLAETMNYLNEIGVNVREKGAVGDGVTDDTVAIQDTIDHVASLGGGTVYVPDGYVFVYTASLKMKSNIKLIGTGTLKAQGEFPAGTSMESSAINIRNDLAQLENVVIDGLTIEAPSSNGESRGIYVSWAKNVTIRNCVVKNANDSGIRVDGYGEVYGGSANRGEALETYTVYTEDIYIQNNKVFDTISGHGIEVISYPSNVIVTGNKIYNPFHHGIRLSGVYQSIASDNIIKSAGEFGIYLAGFKLNVHDNLINGDGTGKYGIRLIDLYDSEIHHNTICNVTLEGIHGGIEGYPIGSVTIKDNEIIDFGMDDLSVWGIILRNEGMTECIVKGNRVISNGTSPRGINIEKHSTQNNQPTKCIVENNYVKVPSSAKVVVLGRESDGGTNIARHNLNADAMTFIENKKGIATFSGDGSTKLFRIIHGLSPETPTYFSVAPASANAGDAEIRFIEHGNTYLDVYFITPPIAGTDNIVLAWECSRE